TRSSGVQRSWLQRFCTFRGWKASEAGNIKASENVSEAEQVHSLDYKPIQYNTPP
ncbi:hypothetical protein A2U01_0082260, partial [Trifolium medium]|nr:hypothetical protein [Trifolium medium]